MPQKLGDHLPYDRRLIILLDSFIIHFVDFIGILDSLGQPLDFAYLESRSRVLRVALYPEHSPISGNYYLFLGLGTRCDYLEVWRKLCYLITMRLEHFQLLARKVLLELF